MAKSLKDDDAKLQGLRSFGLRQPVPEHEAPSIYVDNKSKGEICMKKVIYKARYFWHSIQFNKNRALLEDCLCQELKTNIESKMHYHEREAINYITKL
jgi:hypothetical protein